MNRSYFISKKRDSTEMLVSCQNDNSSFVRKHITHIIQTILDRLSNTLLKYRFWLHYYVNSGLLPRSWHSETLQLQGLCCNKDVGIPRNSDL
jgi:hypothetical protein